MTSRRSFMAGLAGAVASTVLPTPVSTRTLIGGGLLAGDVIWMQDGYWIVTGLAGQAANLVAWSEPGDATDWSPAPPILP